MRFLLVDAIYQLEPGRRAVGVKNVTMSEDFLADHFAHRPIMPGMLIVESLVQLADWVVRCGTDFEYLGLADGFDRMRFRRVVRPGDQLELEVDVTDVGGRSATVRGRARCRGDLAVSAEFSLALHPLTDYLDPDQARQLLHMLTVESVDAAPARQP